MNLGERVTEAFGDRIRARCPDGAAEDADVGAVEHGVEGRGELAVAVADQEPKLDGIKGLNALLAVVSTPTSAPLIAATRLRKGSTNSARGAAKLLADVLATVRRAGAAGLVIVRADSAYYGYDIAAAARRAGARFSVTARLTCGCREP